MQQYERDNGVVWDKPSPGVKKIEAPDGTLVQFPAEMSDAAIEAVMHREYGKKPAGNSGIVWDDEPKPGAMTVGQTAPKPENPLESWPALGRAVVNGIGVGVSKALGAADYVLGAPGRFIDSTTGLSRTVGEAAYRQGVKAGEENAGRQAVILGRLEAAAAEAERRGDAGARALFLKRAEQYRRSPVDIGESNRRIAEFATRAAQDPLTASGTVLKLVRNGMGIGFRAARGLADHVLRERWETRISSSGMRS